MAELWPVELPQKFEMSDYSYMPGSGILRTDMDTGPAKVRRRFTSTVKKHSGTMLMSKVDFRTIFEPWFRDFLFDGAEEFVFPDPWDPDNATIVVRFLIDTGGDAYTVSQFSPTEVKLGLSFEELP